MNDPGCDDQDALVEMDLDGTTTASTAVILAIAELEDQSPLELDSQLHETIDGDALDRAIDSDTSNISVEFSYGAYQVRFENRHLFVAHATEQ
ncbi:HalOD1 output domain-containing protein [Natronorarus salvus]|uniref:HalOD1 output domain-containing protein n=1 Tax=Natronorarus salvus TaxID=3117733 RepID=UPI002F26139C